MKLPLLVFSFLLLWSHAEAGGGIAGTVALKGGGLRKKVSVGIDQAVCGKEQTLEELLVNPKGAVQNAVVSIRGHIAGGKPLSQLGSTFVIDQKGCRFRPHITLVPQGVPVVLQNSDGILHNFHTFSRANPSINRPQTATSGPLTVTFSRPEIFKYECTIHPWMRGWIVVVEHPYYAVTDETGRFGLTDLPAGEYTLQAWHGLLGEQTKPVVVKEGAITTIDFKYLPE